jgi:hypothetical protein
MAAGVEAEVSAHLMAGAREAALTCAVQGKAWPLALLIASVCSADRYKEVVQARRSTSMGLRLFIYLRVIFSVISCVVFFIESFFLVYLSIS